MYPIIALVIIFILLAIWGICKLIASHRAAHRKKSEGQSNESASEDIEMSDTDNSDLSDKPVRESLVGNLITLPSNSTPQVAEASTESLKSKKSFGFVPSIKAVEPLPNHGKRDTQNFLMLLDTLDALDDEDTKRRKMEASYTASSAGIEANSSDETASQTFIGRDLDADNDPGKIHLRLIRALDP